MKTGGTTIDAATAAGVLQTLSRSPELATRIPWIAHRARVGDWVPLSLSVTEVGSGAFSTRLVMVGSIMCNEPWARRDPARTASASRGTYLAERNAADAAAVAAVCSVVPKAPQPNWSAKRVHAATPVLFLAGSVDPQDPPSNITGARSALPNSRTVVVPGGGHGTLQLGCVAKLAQQFIARGTTAGLDTSCVRSYTPPPFVTR